MKVSNFFNNYNVYYYNYFWKNYFYWSIGLNKLFFKNFFKRCYLINSLSYQFNSSNILKDLLFFNLFFSYCYMYIPKIFSFKNFFLYNLLIIDICSIYKTYRHLFGLPVNGQRTWSNANTTYYNNLLLRQYKLKKFSLFLSNSKPLTFKKIFLSEYINFFWQKQFFLEWVSVRRRRYLFQKKNIYINYKVDFNFLVNANVEHFYNRTLMLKKKKVIEKKKHF